jgi:hypothetical protein
MVEVETHLNGSLPYNFAFNLSLLYEKYFTSTYINNLFPSVFKIASFIVDTTLHLIVEHIFRKTVSSSLQFLKYTALQK